MDIQNHGLVIADQSHLHQEVGSHGCFGATPKVLMPQGHGWNNYLILPEQQQQNGLETYACTCASANNAFDTLRNYLLQVPERTSFRFTANFAAIRNGSGTTCELADRSLMDRGYVAESEFGFTSDINTWGEFYSGVPDSVITDGASHVHQVGVNAISFSANPTNMKNALQYSPITATGFAWETGNDNLYHDFGNNPNHRFMIFDYVEGQYWLVYDSYTVTGDQTDQNRGDYIKKLAWDFNFGATATYYIIPNTDSVSLLTKIKNMFTKIVRDSHGGLWFHKIVQEKKPDGSVVNFTGKQKIETWLDFAGAVIDEIGCKTVDDVTLNSWLQKTFFGN